MQSSEFEPADQTHSRGQLKLRRLAVGCGPEQRGRRRFFRKGINFSGAIRFSKNVAFEDCNSEMK